MFVHTSIRTRNLDKSIDFYAKFLGLKLLNRKDITKNNAEIAFLQDPDGNGAILELTFYRNQKKFLQPEYKNRMFDHLAFEIKSMEKTMASMREEGVTVTDEPFRLSPNGSLIAFVEDPDGTPVELIEKK